MDPKRDVVELRIPRKPEYVSVARLAVSGIASRLEFSYDEVEDIKLAVGEACTSAIQETPAGRSESPIVVRCESDPDKIIVEVVNAKAARQENASEESPESISRLLMEVLMDEVEVGEENGGDQSLRMVKYVSRGEA